MSLYARIAAGILLALAVAGVWWKAETMLARAEQRGRDLAVAEMNEKAIAEAQAKAKESLRRLEIQDANQRAQDAELAAARAAADRNARDAERVRAQSAAAAREWAARLADSPTAEDLAAAAEAVRVCTDVLGRADRRAGILASYADAARAAGAKCERDYDALKPLSPPTQPELTSPAP